MRKCLPRVGCVITPVECVGAPLIRSRLTESGPVSEAAQAGLMKRLTAFELRSISKMEAETIPPSPNILGSATSKTAFQSRACEGINWKVTAVIRHGQLPRADTNICRGGRWGGWGYCYGCVPVTLSAACFVTCVFALRQKVTLKPAPTSRPPASIRVPSASSQHMLRVISALSPFTSGSRRCELFRPMMR